MILLAKNLREELEETKINFKSSIVDLTIRVAATSFEINGRSITLSAKKIMNKGHLSWKVTWWLDGRRVGFNALLGKLEGRK